MSFAPSAERAALDSPADRALEECVREVVMGWEFPASLEGIAGPYLARYAYEAAADLAG